MRHEAPNRPKLGPHLFVRRESRADDLYAGCVSLEEIEAMPRRERDEYLRGRGPMPTAVERSSWRRGATRARARRQRPRTRGTSTSRGDPPADDDEPAGPLQHAPTAETLAGPAAMAPSENNHDRREHHGGEARP